VTTPAHQSAERGAMTAFVIAAAGGVAAAISYATEHTELALGLGLAAALLGSGVGLIAWAKSLDVEHDAEQEREPLCLDADQLRGLEDVEQLTRDTLGRRRILAVLAAGSLGSIVLAAIGPIGSLGPKPRGERQRTAWRAGTRAVTTDGTPIRAADGPLDQLITAFPDGAVGRDDSQVVLVRVDPALITARTRRAGTVDGWIAYSKICTHAGCSVGLFGIDPRQPDVVRQLVCPCHQSVFDPLDAAQPVGGPAPRPLPQLPLDVDAEGYLVAQRDFDGPVGPITWNEG